MSAKTYGPYWNPKTELAERSQIERLQLCKFQKTLQHAYDNSRFWNKKLSEADIYPGAVKSLDDVTRVPLLTKMEFLDAQEANPLYGDLLATSTDNAINYHQTSGTSGRLPLRVVDGRRDWYWLADCWAQGLWGFGVRPSDIAYFAFAYGPFIGFWISHYGFEKIGALVVPGGGLSSEARIRQIIELGATVVVATPTYALRLVQVARGMGIDLAKDSVVRLTVHAGEPGASIPATRQAIEEGWGARCGDFGGMSECGANFYFKCSHDSPGVHIHEDQFLQEVIDPQTLQPVPVGQTGELVITPFGRGTLPIIRYRTGDLVKRILAKACTCGRAFDLYEGGIIGRADDMKLIRGVNVYPSAVEGIVRKYREVDEFQIIIHRERVQDEITVNIDPSPAVPSDCCGELCRRISDDLCEAHEWLRFNVVAVQPGSLPRFELKSRRLVDKRPAR